MARSRNEESFEEDDDLPIEINSSLSFYRSDNGTRDSEFRFANRKRDPNPYRDMMEALTPGEMVGQFMAKASPEVQGAVKNTIIGLLGSLRASPAFEASISTTHRALASLMYQLEMTGYMFRNAEYRQALQRSLSAALEPADDDEESSSTSKEGETRQYPTVRGRISVSFGEDSEEVEVDAESYVSELSKEVQALKRQLANLQQEKEQETAKDLLSYVQSMEASEMQSLTDSVSPQVLDAMKQLVDTVIKGMGSDAGKMDEMTQVPASTLAQLCMWQLVVGYNLREMEARESIKNRLLEPGLESDSEESEE